MTSCSKKHTMCISLISETYIEYKECYKCKRKGCRDRPIGNKGFLLYECEECSVYLCMVCS